MLRIKTISILLPALLLLLSCNQSGFSRLTAGGITRELAEYRKNNVTDIVYDIDFSIPHSKESAIAAKVTINFNLRNKVYMLLDFKPSYNLSQKGAIHGIVNGKKELLEVNNEHIILPRKALNRGSNSVVIDFRAGEQSLNRREKLLYTLLVPDRARTLFPCFDQPDLKAKYKLKLEVPKEWKAVANGKAVSIDTLDNSVKFTFSPTEPISTYLFSFVAGVFKSVKESRNGREINIYHREKEPGRLAQISTIFDQIYSSLEWLEEYTSIEYPFTKYDIAIIPGFQYGGMEHMGATLYSDRTMFLDKNATINEELARAKLIAHETAHMWFGDYVTMSWFSDVWIKEVFANWFASRMITPLYPGIDHQLNFLNTYFPPSYAEDRTAGSNPVQQELDNLNRAGLVYGNIIYNKAPIIMEKLVRIIGENKFKEGIREYLAKYAYSNATWDQFIEILDALSDYDLKKWSNVWIKEKGMPHISIKYDGIKYNYSQQDPLNRDIIWEQEIASGLTPDSDGMGYGLFILKDEIKEKVLSLLTNNKIANESERLSAIINIYENLEAGYITPKEYLNTITAVLNYEKNPLIYSRIMGYLNSPKLRDEFINLENTLWYLIEEGEEAQLRTMAFSNYIGIATSSQSTEKLFEIWKAPHLFKSVNLGERELMRLSYEVALRKPELYQQIKYVQLSNLTSKDRKREFEYIFPSVSSKKIIRDSVFNSLLKSKNREVEPWAAAALGYLNHRLKAGESLEYIKPALEILDEIQRTGDIFFPSNWLKSLLSGHSAGEASKTVKDFLDKSSNLHPMLRLKVLQQSGHLFAN